MQEAVTIGTGTIALVTAAVVGSLEVAKLALKTAADALKARRSNGHAHSRRDDAGPHDTKTLPVPRGEFYAVVHDLAGEQARLDRAQEATLTVLGEIRDRLARIEGGLGLKTQ